jgi:CHAD domain-containing protein
MSYQLGEGEGAGRAIQRIAGEQLDRAIAELSGGVQADPVTAVHSARKALKKERSLLRLARGTLRSSERRRMNAAVRDAGRKLSAARDAEVMIQAVDALAEHYAGQLPKKTFTTLNTHLEAQAKSARESLAAGELTGEVVAELRALRLEVERWHLRSDGWKAIGPGLRRSYQRGQGAHRRAAKKPTVENLHEWRKRGKDLWYHLRLLEPLSPDVIHGQAKEAHHLSDVLGDDHDLAVLRTELIAGGADIPVDLESVIALIDHRREQLQTDAMRVGARLYAETPKALHHRIRSYWTVWRSPVQQTSPPVQLRGRHAVGATPT